MSSLSCFQLFRGLTIYDTKSAKLILVDSQEINGTGLNHLSILSHCKILMIDVEELQVVGDW